MPEYLSPGVYVEEFEIGAKPIEGVATSTAGFLGEAEYGSSEPLLTTSWLDYKRKFGGYFGPTKYLPHAVKGFFDNGGKRCYVGRIVSKDATDPALKASKPFGTLQVDAIGEGTWGNRVHVIIEHVPLTPAKTVFNLVLVYWSGAAPATPFDPRTDEKTLPRPTHVEEFSDLEMDEASPNYVDKRVNHGNSNLVWVKATGPALPPATVLAPLENGADGAALIAADYVGKSTAGKRTGLNALKESRFDDIAILYAPNPSGVPGLTGELITHCENNKYRFAIIDSAENQANVSNLKPRDDHDTKYASFYYPWIRIIDAQTGARRQVPPGGHVAGIYARSDIERGVWKAPANEVVRGAVELEYKIGTGEQDVLNPRGVNVIRPFPGRGRRVWGARTLSSDPLWKYTNVRRLFIFLEHSIFNGTQWVVFEPNSEVLWARVRQTIEQFLRTQWRAGALMGLKESEAFFVRCDRSTMTQDDIDNGRLIVVIGVAPVKPAEFVIFRIAQFTAGDEGA